MSSLAVTNVSCFCKMLTISGAGRWWWKIFLVAQCLRLCASNAGGVGSIPGQGTETLHVPRQGQSRPWQTKTQLGKRGVGYMGTLCMSLQLSFASQTVLT